MTTLLQDPMGEPRGVTFSPDSKWLTYTRTGNNEYSIVYVYNLVDRKEYPVTDKWYDSSSPVFSTDGKYLVFASARDFNPTYGSLEWNHVYNNMYGVYLAMLSKDTPSPFIEKDAEVAVAKEESKKNTPAKKENIKKDELATAVVKIDFDGITDRIVKLPVSPSYYGNFYSDGNKVYYWGRGGTKVFDLKEQKEDVVADGASMGVEPGSKKALFFKKNALYVTDIPLGKADLSDPVNLSNMKITVDYPKEWAQIFDEAWRAFRDGFYLENMHG